MFDRQHTLAHIDPELWASIQNENHRQEEHIELIASKLHLTRSDGCSRLPVDQ